MIAAAAAPAAAGAGSEMGALLIALVAIFVGTRLFGALAQRVGQPAVLGELIAGVLLGGSALGLLDPADPVMHALSELGVLVLLFAIGLETRLASLVRVGGMASAVAVTGVILPFVLGYVAATALNVGFLAALVCGAALCATSIGITARVLSDLGRLETTEGQVILSAAVIDDILGLSVLAVVASIVTGRATNPAAIGFNFGVAIAFVAGALVIGNLVAKPMFAAIERIRVSGAVGTMGLAFAFLLAWLAERSGSAMIIGAFAAGLVLFKVPQRKEIERAATTLGHFFVPIFFAAVGAAVDLRALADRRALMLGGALIAAGIVGKVVAGYAAWWMRGDKLLVGIGMVPRGEVGLIVARLGLAVGAVSGGEYGALMLMVLVTTLVTPPVLAWRVQRVGGRRARDDRPGDGGVDDLVAGTGPSLPS